MVIVLIGIRGIEYLERLKAYLDVLESVAGDAYGLGILVDRIKHTLLDVMNGIRDEASPIGRVETVGRSSECGIAGRDEFFLRYVISAEFLSTRVDEAEIGLHELVAGLDISLADA
jgi:hypothetical protein